MSQPPAQQGPYGGQPDPYGQPGAGQPNFGQQAPGQPVSDQFGQFGQTGLAGQSEQQGQFGQQPADYGQPGEAGVPGYPPGFRPAEYVRPTKKRTGLIVGVIAAVVVVIGAGIGAYFLFFHKSETQTADEVVTGFAQAYTSLAHTMSAADLAKVKTFLCGTDQRAVESIYQHEKSTGGADSTFSLTTSSTVTNGNTGTFSLVIKDKNGQPQTDKGSLVKQNDKWLVCNTLVGS